MTPRRLSDFYVASCEKDGGVCEFSLFEDGSVEMLRMLHCPSPMYLAKDEGRLYTLLRAPFEDSDFSGVTVFDEKGCSSGEIVSTCGEVGCHISVSASDAYCANYISGSICRLGKAVVHHSGGGVDPARQVSAHPHSVIFSPDKKYVFTADLGTDKVYVYTRDLELIACTSVPKGSGARHLCFSKCGKFLYCIGEMKGNVTVFSWDGAALSAIRTVDLLKEGTDPGSGAAIKLSHDGSHIYVTERRDREIITLAVNGADLHEVSRISSHGTEPRDILELADGRFLICANQWSNSVSIFSLHNSIPSYLSSFSISSPIALLEA